MVSVDVNEPQYSPYHFVDFGNSPLGGRKAEFLSFTMEVLKMGSYNKNTLLNGVLFSCVLIVSASPAYK